MRLRVMRLRALPVAAVATVAVIATGLPASAAGNVSDAAQAPWGVALKTASGKATSVYSVLRTGDHIYLAGYFDKLASNNGASTASAANFAALLPDGTPDQGFNPASGTPAIRTDGSIRAMSIGPDGRLYLGGTFTHVNGVARYRVARLNLSPTGGSPTLDSWAPSLTGSQTGWSATDQTNPCATGHPVSRPPAVYGVAFGPDGVGGERVYIGGTFAFANGTAVTNAVAVSPLTGGVDPTWTFRADNGDESMTCDIHGPSVRTFQVNSDGSMYAAGEFDYANGVTRHAVVDLNSSGSLVTTFRDPFNNGNDSFDITLGTFAGNSTLIVGGTGIHNDIHFLNPTTGAKNHTSIQSDGDVQTLAVQGGELYVGGHFLRLINVKSTDPVNYVHLARINMSTGTVDANWRPWMMPQQVAGYFYGVWSLAAYSGLNGNYLYAGGAFSYVQTPTVAKTNAKKFTWFQG